MNISEGVSPCEMPAGSVNGNGSVIRSKTQAISGTRPLHYAGDDGMNGQEDLPTSISRPHAVLLPYPLQGHINPMVQFGKALAIKHGFRVTFVNNRHNHDRIIGNNSTRGDSKSLIEFVWVENGLPEDFDYSDIVPRGKEFHQGVVNMREPFKDLLLSLNKGEDQHKTRVSCVVFGSFCLWPPEVCREVGVPSVLFWTQSASVLDIYCHSHLLEQHGFFPFRKPDLNTNPDDEGGRLVDYLPGIPPLRPSDVPSLLHVESIDDPTYQYTKQQKDVLTDCKCAVINSFYELEVEACEALRAANSGSLSIHMVGPLLPPAFLHEASNDTVVSDTRVGTSLLEEKTDCIQWLDRHKEASVLYISFGSMFTPSDEEWRTIAAGVQASGQPFLCVVRPRSSLQSLLDILPAGFLEETKDRGMIVPWAPQLQVLSHRAVGAFLSHCGWNSTLESLSLGVPILPFPIFSDQTTDCRYIVDVWKVGLEFNRSPVDNEEVSRVVTMALQGDEGHRLRTNARTLREAARKAILPRGSSGLDMQRFVRAIIAKQHLQSM